MVLRSIMVAAGASGLMVVATGPTATGMSVGVQATAPATSAWVAGLSPTVVRPRASLTAVMASQPSGKLLVSVASDARRVRLTWVTAGGTKRSATLRLRNGSGARYLARGATRVLARALATSTRKASPRVAPATVEQVMPAPVTALSVTVIDATTITLTWLNPTVPGVAEVVVRRARGRKAPTTPNQGTEVPVASPTATTATDTAPGPGATYSYSVFALDQSGMPSPAAVGTATMPGAPTGCDRTIRLGQSVQGRAIGACQLSGASEAAPRTVLVVGSMHGNEQAGSGITARLRALDLTGRGANVWVIDTVNPDGARASKRGNANGVDLNRNFPTQGWKPQGAGTSLWGGPTAGSEPETRSLISAVKELRPTEVVVFHQQMNLIDCAPYRPLTLSRTLHDLTGYRYLSPASCLPTYVGTFTAWANQNHDWTSAVTFELEASPSAAKLDRLAEAMVQLAAR